MLGLGSKLGIPLLAGGSLVKADWFLWLVEDWLVEDWLVDRLVHLVAPWWYSGSSGYWA
jgi:hypothetical protein